MHDFSKNECAIDSKFDATLINGKAFMNGISSTDVEKEKKLPIGVCARSPTGIIAIRTTTVSSKVSRKGEKRKSASTITNYASDTEHMKKARYNDPQKSDLSATSPVLSVSSSCHNGLTKNLYGNSTPPINLNEKLSNSDTNEVYRGLLNNVTHEERDSRNLAIRSRLKQITRKDLEDMIIEQFMNKLLYDSEMGQQQELCKRLEATLESSNKKALKLTKEVARLKDITEKLADEHNKRKSQFVIPVKVKRSVGLQVGESYVNEDPQATQIAPSIFKNENLPQREDASVAIITNTSELTKPVIGEMFSQKTQTSMQQLKPNKQNKYSNESSNEGSLAFSLSTSSNINHYTMKNNDIVASCSSKSDEEEIIIDNLFVNKKSSYVPLPIMPSQRFNGINKTPPPRPKLRLQQKNKSIILSWDVLSSYDIKSIASFQLFSYDEGTENRSDKLVWKKIGSVKALELPMACTLTQFKGGRAYHFAVRAVDVHGMVGPYSMPKVIRLPP